MNLRWPVSRVRRVYMRPPFLTSPKSCRSINTLPAITTISIHQRPFARARARGQKCSMSLALCRDSRIAVSTSSAVPLRAAARGDVPADLFAHASTCRARLPKIVRSMRSMRSNGTRCAAPSGPPPVRMPFAKGRRRWSIRRCVHRASSSRRSAAARRGGWREVTCQAVR